ncbi:sigma-54-dependent transcriptional regulator [Vulcaniibacterium tengchongense]|uniref:DNA-binding NtrC family response regulator n=1 Tax=Vulcaniibacterium tengchongense TaxID=1273429 RepID=A0A3N4V1V8_9GAMM|nr:sigma-54 dependent transcriptional regulator [Vulcaniibacterium tengchongense]RPE76916.1 DNA-binding NtrC family response regulator [Vulcaniibacterium tengchongense]
MNPSLLIVDDDHSFAQSAADFARSRGFQPFHAQTLAQSRQLARSRSHDLVLLDLDLPDGNGLDLLQDLDAPELSRIAIVTGQPTLETARRAVSLPVSEYLLKPLCPEQFDALLSNAAARSQPLPTPSGERLGIVGDCAAMRQVMSDIERVAPTAATVLVHGASGTGKELVARAVHARSGRSGPLIAVNAGAIAPDLLASHLFGHERGSFTGAATRHIGYFEQANHGTLFLDEITEMPLQLQVYLLRVLETGAVTRVGGTDAIPVDVRIVAATNRNPWQAVEAGALREDLFYRLADFQIELPPLSARGSDVILLARLFLQRLNEAYRTEKRFADGTERALKQHTWPGNVRELRSAVLRGFLTGDGDVVHVRPGGRRVPAAHVEHNDAATVTFTVGMSYAEVEREMLRKTLAHFGNDRTRTAKALGVSVRTIHNQLARMRRTGQV